MVLGELGRQGDCLVSLINVRRVKICNFIPTGVTPYEPDLQQLWKDLCVINTPEGAKFDDGAALADVRRAITAVPPA
jgi:hypothetical protein